MEHELTKDERDLMTVVKHVNDNWPIVKEVTMKLLAINDGDYEYVSDVTSFSIASLEAIVSEMTSKKVEPKMEEVSKPLKYRKYFRRSSFPTQHLYGRVAWELYLLIKKEYKMGDRFLSSDEVKERFNCGDSSATRAFEVLSKLGAITGGNRTRYTVNF